VKINLDDIKLRIDEPIIDIETYYNNDYERHMLWVTNLEYYLMYHDGVISRKFVSSAKVMETMQARKIPIPMLRPITKTKTKDGVILNACS
jgi:hypothetical protein